MDIFYIDRQFGLPIWIDVENGTVLRCYGESEKYNDRMNKLYMGNTINFLNEDFIGRAMKGTYHHLRPDCITERLRRVVRLNEQIGQCWNKYSSNNTPKEHRPVIKVQIDNLEKELYEAERLLNTEKERILKEHNFKV